LLLKRLDRLGLVVSSQSFGNCSTARLGSKADMCSAQADVRYVPKADIANIGLSVSAKIKTLSKFYFTTPQAIRAPPPPKGFGWSE
jgi:hypothetical protein